MSEFNVGDIVCTNQDSLAHNGDGMILCIDDDGCILIEFFEHKPYRHNGNGLGKDGHCWWFVNDSNFTLVKQEILT